MRYTYLLLILILTTLGCRSRKTVANVEQTQEQSVEDVKIDLQKKDYDLAIGRSAYDLRSLDFGYNFTLSTLDSAKPARFVEYREGKPYRELGVENGSYTENKAIKDSSIQETYKALEFKFNNLKMLYSKQNVELERISAELTKTKTEGKKMANNFKYGFWFLLAFAFIWICERAGLFGLFKRLLKSV